MGYGTARFIAMALLAGLYAPPGVATAQTVLRDAQPITIGETLTLHSAVLHEDRRVMVHLPPDYAVASRRYPVIYLLDGELLFEHMSGIVDYLSARGRMPASIVVGIVNANRNRDLLPQATDPTAAFETLPFQAAANEEARGSGGADKFLSFLTRELAPAIEAKYRTANFRILAGHSYGGLFTSYVLMKAPDAFSAYLAASPTLWWDDRALLRRASQTELSFGTHQHWLYVGTGEEGANMLGTLGDLKTILTLAAPNRLSWEAHVLPDETHVMTSHRVFYDGLLWLFRDYALDEHISMAGDIARVERHFTDASVRYGIDLSPSEEMIGHVGYSLIRSKRVVQALIAFRRNVELHPMSPNAYDSLADGLEAGGRDGEALAARERAVALAAAQRDLRLDDYTAGRDRLMVQLSRPAKTRSRTEATP